jgi:hypothetical protein
MLPKDDRATSGKRLTFIFNAGRRVMHEKGKKRATGWTGAQLQKTAWRNPLK